MLKQTVSRKDKNYFPAKDPKITQLLASRCKCSKQYDIGHLSLTMKQKNTQAPSEFKEIRVVAFIVETS